MRRRLIRTSAALLGLFVVSCPLSADPLGPSSRRTSWVVSEIHYHPGPQPGERNPEFVEIHNAGLIAEDLGGHRLAGDLDYLIPPGTVVAAGGFAVVAPNPADVASTYNVEPSAVLGPATGRLDNRQGTVRLLNPAGAVLLEVSYAADEPWPAAAAGAGHSLVLARPSFGERQPTAWQASAVIGGSPGRLEPVPDTAFRTVRLNEILARTAPPTLDFVELHNASSIDVDLSGARLTDDPERAGFTLPAGTILPAHGFRSFSEHDLGFALDAAGEAVFLYAPSGNRVVDALRFSAQAAGISLGRYPDGQPGWRSLQSPTPNSANAPVRSPAVVINEILYHPISGNDDDEFIELFNPGETPVDLAGWRLVDGVSFQFPEGATLPAQGYAVVARNAARLRSHYPTLNSHRVFGDFDGSLSDRGERIALARPDDLVRSPEPGDSPSQRVWIVVAEVTYADGGAWGRWADGGGSSLELRDPRADPSLAANWADSDESAKATWSVIEATGVLDQGVGTIDQIQLVAQGAGAWLVDDVEVLDAGGANRVSNSRFDSGTSGWIMQGTQSGSRWEAGEGTAADGSLHVEAVARGDTGANRIRSALTSSLPPGSTATLRARVRWLRGHPEFLLRLRGNYLEAFGSLSVPTHLGTPGAPNSRLVPNAGPALWDLNHTPLLPGANQPIVVSVRGHDPDGIASLRVRYRLDPSTATTELAMTDDGRNGDASAEDGVFTATIPPQPNGRIIAFQILARDGHPTPTSTLFPASEALVRTGETRPPGTLGTYRIWMTQETFNRWSNRSKLDNAPLPVAFAYGDERVIQGAEALFAGSPHISPGYSTPSGNLCGYIVKFPDDDPFLGVAEIVLDWPGRDATAQQEPTAYWIARELGIPFNHRRYIRLHVNGVTEASRGSIYEDAQQVNSDLIESWNPQHTGGDLFKIEQWFEYSDGGSTTAVIPPRLEMYTTTGGQKKLARYRWTWLKRALNGPANDYQRLFTLVDVANAPDPGNYLRQLDAFVDIEEWMRVFAVENIVVNLDAWGYDIGKNMYAYAPPADRWRLYMWDIDWVMLASAQHGYSPTSPLMYLGPAVFGESNRDPVVGRMYQQPVIQRAYWRAIHDAVSGPLLPDRVAARLDATHAALIAQGVTRSSGSSLASPAQVKTWLRQRRDYLVSQLDSIATPFTVLPPPASLSGTNLLTLEGTAPISIATLRFNGRPFPVTWSTVQHWSARIPLAPGDNTIGVQGYDHRGNPVPESAAQIHVRFDGTLSRPDEGLVIHEIQARPPQAGAAFVELFNRSPHTAYDLSGWRLDGLGLSFASGVILPPLDYLLVASNRQAIATAYGIAPQVDAVWSGQLNPAGETLALLLPGATPDTEVPVHSLRFETQTPWPVPSPESTASLQLVDASQDNRHPANWAIATPGAAPSPQTLIPLTQRWRYFQGQTPPALNWNQPGFQDGAWPDGTPLFFQESADLPGPKSTELTLGPAAYYFRTPFHVSDDTTAADLAINLILDDGAVVYLNGSELFRLGMPEGPVTSTTFATRVVGDATQESVLVPSPSTLRTGDNLLAVEVHQANAGSSDVVFGMTLESRPRPTLAATPDAPNSVRRVLPALPTLWINEVQPENRSGPVDLSDEHEPWLEIINAGAIVEDLSHCQITDPRDPARRWAFPSGTRLSPGEILMVWLDGEPSETEGGELHASWRLSPTSGLVALSLSLDGQSYVLDAVAYSALAADHLIALIPDGQPDQRWIVQTPTPGLPNREATEATNVVINEWMSSNQTAVQDPADGDFEDWFELHNPGTDTADLTGLFLTDDPLNPRKFAIPADTRIGPGGFLVVWADEETSQNEEGTDLHANFRLSQNGESISLVSADGTILDSVQLPAMSSDTVGGRWPDGGQTSGHLLRLPTPGAPNQAPAEETVVRILGLSHGPGGVMSLSWTTDPGRDYRIEATPSLNPPNWSGITPPVRAASTTTTSDLLIEGNPSRFYRVTRIP